jgi:hypothetical protein
MPFDGQQPDLAALAQLLREPERWPEGFEWDYSNRGTCAIGLCEAVFGIAIDQLTRWGEPAWMNIVFWRMRHSCTAADLADTIERKLNDR